MTLGVDYFEEKYFKTSLIKADIHICIKYMHNTYTLGLLRWLSR